jgi:exodeoxyribonuclease V alpha subunit
VTDTPDQTPTPAERKARAEAAMRAAEAAAGALDGPDASKPAPAPPPEPAGSPEEGLRALGGLFAETGVPAALASRAVARLGPGAAGRLRDDPWRLLSVPGVQPGQADHFAVPCSARTPAPTTPAAAGPSSCTC